MAVLAAEIEPHALAPAERAGDARHLRLLRPFAQSRDDLRVENLRPLLAPVFPRKIAIPRLERGAGGPLFVRSVGTGQCEIADRDHVSGIARMGVAAAIAERIKLLNITE